MLKQFLLDIALLAGPQMHTVSHYSKQHHNPKPRVEFGRNVLAKPYQWQLAVAQFVIGHSLDGLGAVVMERISLRERLAWYSTDETDRSSIDAREETCGVARYKMRSDLSRLLGHPECDIRPVQRRRRVKVQRKLEKLLCISHKSPLRPWQNIRPTFKDGYLKADAFAGV